VAEFACISDFRRNLQDTDDGREPPQQVTIFESTQNSISFLKKVEWKKRKMYDKGDMKISPGDPHCGCQGHYCMPHPHT
jgi:hypothetical protein